MYIRGNCLKVFLRRLDRVYGFDAADDCNVIEGVIAFAAHAIKKGECGGEAGREMLLGELDNRDMVAELDAWALAAAQHQGQRPLEHGLIGGLVGSFLIDDEVFAGGGCFLVCVCQELLDLLRVDLLRFCLLRLRRHRVQSA